MIIITSAGVFFSTFLNAFVSLLSTFAAVLGGYFVGFIGELAQGEVIGGGPFESMKRLVDRDPISVPLESSAPVAAMQFIDSELIAPVLGLVVRMLPDRTTLSNTNFVASGLDINFSLLFMQTVKARRFMTALVLAGHYILKGRELAK